MHAGKLAKKTLSLAEKVKFLDFAIGNPTVGCRKLTEIFKIRKTAAANIIKEEENMRSQHELLHEKPKKRNWPGKHRKINEILYEWNLPCCASNIYQCEPTLKEEAKAIKKDFRTVALTILGLRWLDG